MGDGNTNDASLPVWVTVQNAAAALPRQIDALVVGGGVTGLLTAVRLREQGRRVVVLESRNLGSAQSGRNLGFIREQGREPVEAMAMREANRAWRSLASARGPALGWTQGGHLSIARDSTSLERIAQWGGVASEHGVPFQILRPRDLEERVPWLAPDLAGAGFTPDDGHVDPRSAVAEIAALAREVGVEVREGVTVTRLSREGGRIVGVEVGDRGVKAEVVVLAAGAWSSRLLRDAGIRLPLHVGRATVGLTAAAPPITRSSAWEVGGAGFRQSSDGRIAFGLGAFVDVDVRWEDVMASASLLPTLWRNRRTMRVHVGRDVASDAWRVVTRRGLEPFARTEPKPNLRDINDGLRQLGELVPILRSVPVDAVWAGVMDSTPDFLPIAGEAGLGGLLLIVGTSGHGLGMAPSLAEGIAKLADGGAAPEYFSAFSRTRF